MPGSPFPQGLPLPNGPLLGRLITTSDVGFWIHATRDGRRALIMTNAFWSDVSIPADDDWESRRLSFGDGDYRVLIAGGQMDELHRIERPLTADMAMPFARALASVPEAQTGGIYIGEQVHILAFAVEGEPPLDKDAVLGRYLSGGIDVLASDIVALERIVPKIDHDDLVQIVDAAGIAVKSAGRSTNGRKKGNTQPAVTPEEALIPFALPGREMLSDFFNEHVIEIIADEARYAALGIGFPGGIILEGPTGCGKTFAVEKLIEHLGWRSFSIDASSVASPYIHETSRKVAEVFNEAKKAAPAVIVIDEMDAFLTDRSSGTDQHRLEEVAEFLRRIPEASANRVLIIGMTNKIDLIDPAILRRGRFDHVIHVDHAGRAEIEGLLGSLLAEIPHDLENFEQMAEDLAGRPLSDAAFVVREAGRLAARAGRDRISENDVARAMSRTPSRDPDNQQRMGF